METGWATFSSANSAVAGPHSLLHACSSRKYGVLCLGGNNAGSKRKNIRELRQNASWLQNPVGKRGRGTSSWKLNALPDWPLMVVMIEHVANQRDFVVHKSIWHLSDVTMKNIYTMYIMFTVWGCCFFGSTKDPFYDGEEYRKDGGDGTAHWLYERQEDIEESARAELWREELIEEIEQKVGGLRELEESKEEQLVK